MLYTKFLVIIILFSQIYSTEIPRHIQDIRIMSYNIRIASDKNEHSWNNRKADVVNNITTNMPDIIGIQEANYMQRQYLNWNLFYHGYFNVGDSSAPSLSPHEILAIAHMEIKHKKRMLNKLFYNLKESTPIYYNIKRIKLLEHQTFYLDNIPVKPTCPKFEPTTKNYWYSLSKWEEELYEWTCDVYKKNYRICTYASFIDIETKQIFWIFNTHLSLKNSNNTEQIKPILEIIKNKKKPTFLIGDLSATPNSKLLKNILNSMTNTKQISNIIIGPESTFNNWGKDEYTVDYILVNKDILINPCTFATVVDENKHLPSDHYPIIFDFSFYTSSTSD